MGDHWGFEEHYFECECSTPEHMIKFLLHAEEKELHVSVFLHHWQPWYKRIWVAVKYAFGYKCKYGHFDSTIVRARDAERLVELLRRVT